MIKSIFLGLFAVKLVVLLLAFNIPAQVYAGIFSLVSGSDPHLLLSGDSLRLQGNSQNIALLRADLTPNYSLPDSFDRDLKVVGGVAFLPKVGAVLEDETPLVSGRGGGLVTTHKVKEGETVSSIAAEYGISQSTILWENDLTSKSIISPGDELVILPFDGVRHKVKKGDTLSEIAELYDVSLREIADFNRFDPSDVLIPGNHINIPGGEKKPARSTVSPQRSSASPAPSARPAPQPAPQATSGYFRTPLNNYRITQGLHSYNAIDFAPSVGGSGAPIYAAAEGTVTESSTGWNGGYGNLVVISHPNGTRTLYAHNRVNYVSVGEYVSKGQVIAEVGNTGISTGPHVHFEVHGAANPFR